MSSTPSPHITPADLSRFIDRGVSPDEAAHVARHLTTCDTCHAVAEDLRNAGRHLAQLAPEPTLEPPCPAPHVWTEFVADGTRADLERHLTACPDCRAVLAEKRLGTAGAPSSAAPEGTLVCFRCRAALSDAAQFCPQCGAQITARTGMGSLVREGPGLWFTSVWLAVSLGGLVLSFFWSERFYQCLVVSLGCFLFWLHLRNPVRQYLDVLTALQRGDTAKADAMLQNLRRRFGAGRGR